MVYDPQTVPQYSPRERSAGEKLRDEIKALQIASSRGVATPAFKEHAQQAKEAIQRRAETGPDYLPAGPIVQQVGVQQTQQSTQPAFEDPFMEKARRAAAALGRPIPVSTQGLRNATEEANRVLEQRVFTNQEIARQQSALFAQQQVQMEAQQIAQQKFRDTVNTYREVEKQRTNEMTYALQYTDIPASAENDIIGWVERRKAIATNQDLPANVREAAANELEDARTINTEDVLGNTFARVLAAIGVSLGAGGAAMTGGPNMAMQSLHAYVDREIAAKRGAAQRRQKALEARGKAEERDLKWAEDDMIRDLQDKNYELAKIDLALKELQTRYAFSKAADDIAIMQAQNNQALEKNITEIGMRKAAMGMERDLALLKTQQAIGAPGTEALPYGTRLLPGAQPPSKEDSREVKKGIQKFLALKANIDRAIELRDELGAETGVAKLYSPGDRAKIKEMENLRSAIVDGIRNAFEWGARFEESEEKLLKARVPESLTGPGWVLDELKAFALEVDRTLQKKLEPYGVAYGAAPASVPERSVK